MFRAVRCFRQIFFLPPELHGQHKNKSQTTISKQCSKTTAIDLNAPLLRTNRVAFKAETAFSLSTMTALGERGCSLRKQIHHCINVVQTLRHYSVADSQSSGLSYQGFHTIDIDQELLSAQEQLKLATWCMVARCWKGETTAAAGVRSASFTNLRRN